MPKKNQIEYECEKLEKHIHLLAENEIRNIEEEVKKIKKEAEKIGEEVEASMIGKKR